MKMEENSSFVIKLVANEYQIQWQYNNIDEHFIKAFNNDKDIKDTQWLRGKKPE